MTRIRVPDPLTFDFKYEVRVNVCLPLAWVKFIQEVSQIHYDALCKSAGKQGGFIYGLCNVAQWNEDETDHSFNTHSVGWDECDLMCKIMEQADFVITRPGMEGQRDELIEMYCAILKWLRETKDKITERHQAIQGVVFYKESKSQ